MEAIHKLEDVLAKQYNKLPHLPVGFRTWLADYAWVIVLVGVILSAFALISLFWWAGVLLLGLGYGGAAIWGSTGGAAGVAIGIVTVVTLLISTIVYIIEVILMGMAISPLKEYKKRGWDLIFIVLIINAASVAISSILSLQLFTLLWGILWIAVAGYFLFEVRQYFMAKKLITKPVDTDKEIKM